MDTPSIIEANREVIGRANGDWFVAEADPPRSVGLFLKEARRLGASLMLDGRGPYEVARGGPSLRMRAITDEERT